MIIPADVQYLMLAMIFWGIALLGILVIRTLFED